LPENDLFDVPQSSLIRDYNQVKIRVFPHRPFVMGTSRNSFCWMTL